MRALVSTLLLASVAGLPAAAGTGAGELSLDRAAILGMLEAALPPPATVSVPGLPDLTVRIDRPRDLQFADGGVEATLSVSVEQLRYTTAVRVRYAPEVTRPEGIVTLRAVSAIPDSPVPVTLDLARLLPEVPLPRAMSWTVDGPGGGGVELTCLVQGVEVEEHRLVVQLGLLSRRLSLAPPASGR